MLWVHTAVNISPVSDYNVEYNHDDLGVELDGWADASGYHVRKWQPKEDKASSHENRKRNGGIFTTFVMILWIGC